MDTRPNKSKYRRLISASVVQVIASIELVLGIAIIVLSFTSKYPVLTAYGIYIGIAVIMISVPLFIIVNIAEDLHWQSYLKEYYSEETYIYHLKALEKLNNIERLLMQQNASRQAAQNPEEYTYSKRSYHQPRAERTYEKQSREEPQERETRKPEDRISYTDARAKSQEGPYFFREKESQ